MSARIKTFIGTLLILLWLFFYTLFAMRLAAAILPGAGWFAELAYYAFAGLAWVVPPGFLIQWMAAEPMRR
mgnify:CR=1 FL=1